jgi:drug/metabolite transporter (DMT)-like permease
MAAGVTLFRGVAPGAVDLWSIGLWALLVVLAAAELFVLRGTHPGRGRVVGLIAMAGVGVCMVIAYSSFGTPTSSGAMLAAGILVVIAGFSIWRHNRTLR